MILPLALFAQLAAQCGPSVHVDTLAALARTESGFETNALGDNTDGHRYRPRRLQGAVALAAELVTVQRHSVDLGLMQINSANLPGLGLTLADAFDPCKNIAAGARLLAADYQPPADGQDDQPALFQALSRYNTGEPHRGLTNGYVAKVRASAQQVVPALRVMSGAGVTAPAEAQGPPAPRPPSWNVFATARYAREHREGVALAPPMATAEAPVGDVTQPVRLQAIQWKAARPAVRDAR